MGGRGRGGEGEGGKGREGGRGGEMGQREVGQGGGRERECDPTPHKTLPSHMNACDKSDQCQRLHLNRYVCTKSFKLSANEFTTHNHMHPPSCGKLLITYSAV